MHSEGHQPSERGTPKKPSTFTWVEGRSKKETNRIIHRHAMKEIGKTRRRPKKSMTFELNLSALNDKNQTPSFPLPDVQPSWWLGLPLTASIGWLDPFISYPIPIDASSRALIANVFQDDGGQQRPLRDAWFTMGIQDEAAFYMVLSNSALHLDSRQKGGKRASETTLSTRNYSRAIKSIMKRFPNVSDPGVLDGLIGAITGCMAHADILGSSDAWKTHHKGLQELIRLRGGVSQIERNEYLRVTVSWCELRGAYLSDVKPCFPLPTQWLHHAQTSYIPRSPDMLARIGRFNCIWNHEFPRHIHWIRMLDDLITLSLNTFNSATSFMEKKNDPTVGVWTNVLIYTFLSERPLLDHQRCVGTAPSHAITHREAIILEACRLGVLLFMIPVWRFFGVLPAVSDVLVKNARSILDENQHTDWGNYLWPLKLWVLYVGGVEVSDPVSGAWFAASISQIIIEKQLGNWEGAMEVVKTFLWFECLFKGRDNDLKHQVGAILG